MRSAYRISIVQFHFRSPKDEEIEVRFCHEADGTPSIITFFVGEDDEAKRIIGNREGRWKPCATHAKELFRDFLDKPVRGNHAKQRKQRAKVAKAPLKLFSGGAADAS